VTTLPVLVPAWYIASCVLDVAEAAAASCGGVFGGWSELRAGGGPVHQGQSIRAEELQRGIGEVAGDRSVPGRAAQGRRAVRDGLEPVNGEFGEECVPRRVA
jgi:hypothetical protein